MVPDCIKLLAGEGGVLLNDHGALGAVAQGHPIIDRVEGNLLPLPCGVILHVPGAGAVEVGLADVVEQRHHDHAVIRDGVHHLASGHILPIPAALLGIRTLPGEQPPQRIQDVEAVLEETARGSEVVLGAGGGPVEVAFLDVLQQLVHAGALNLGQLRLKAGDVVLDVHFVSSSNFSCGGYR